MQEQQIRELVAQHGSPLLVVDCAKVERQYRALTEALPGVDMYYAIKSFPNPAVINTLNQLGAGFDLATIGEIELVRQQFISPRRTIHTHPIKKDRDIREALRFGCTTFVVDNVDELEKFRPYRHRVGLLLRVSFRSRTAAVDLSKKFGCTPEDVPQMLYRAAQLGIRIKGLSFHVGSQSGTADMHVAAIRACAALMEQHQCLAPLSILDIGGGFPVNYDGETPDIGAFCAPILEALAELPADIQVIAEPGRFLSAPCGTAITSVVGKAQREGHYWYYLDDGVYGSFSGRLFDHATYPLRVFRDGPLHPSVLTGPTCDSIDVIAEGVALPELQIGDLIVGDMMGAYTAATATEFNSLPKASIVVLNEPVQDNNVVYIS